MVEKDKPFMDPRLQVRAGIMPTGAMAALALKVTDQKSQQAAANDTAPQTTQKREPDLAAQ